MFLMFDAVLVVGSVWLAADGVPTFNVEPFCREVARRAAPVGDVNVCPRQEREARDQLAKDWNTFTSEDRTSCSTLATMGGDPTYTELLTCLELQRDARNLREKEQGTAGRR